ncbi:MAG: N-acetyltransferase [Saprospiraceae bacterium]|nr:MAG: N-acetyltransferase [Saprospiraceae bacterium]
MNLSTKRLELRELSWKDLSDIHRMNSYPEVAEFNTIGIPMNLETTKALIQPIIEDQQKAMRKKYGWVALLNDTGTFIGEVGINLKSIKYNSGEIYYSLLPCYWGQGYATEIVKGILRFGFDTLGLHRIEAGVATGNFSSIRVLEKVGMSKEGLHRQILPLREGWKDNFHYAILESDWKQS